IHVFSHVYLHIFIFSKGELILKEDQQVFDITVIGPIKEWGLEIEKNSIVVNTKQETNIEGIYAAGDVCTYEGKVKLIASGFGEAPTAVSNAKTYMDPKARVQPAHSTSLFAQ
ncbi:FAD-dependent oxidoreductase, partial [Priestia filamentosa]|uniref:FAD-dependent oxidoreductase n=1 Tax=Priestia filamentosa TaxID=1402861 RepID=UPI003979E2D0